MQVIQKVAPQVHVVLALLVSQARGPDRAATARTRSRRLRRTRRHWSGPLRKSGLPTTTKDPIATPSALW